MCKYCRICGGELEHAKGEIKTFCSDCGITFFYNLAAGIGDPKDSLIHRLEILEKKVAELDREAMMHRLLGPIS